MSRHKNWWIRHLRDIFLIFAQSCNSPVMGEFRACHVSQKVSETCHFVPLFCRGQARQNTSEVRQYASHIRFSDAGPMEVF